MLIDATPELLGWPEPAQIWSPVGSGPAMYARLAREKIGGAVARLPEGRNARVGILAENPFSEATEAPLAIVCDFPSPISPSTLGAVNKLAWNFCRSRLLFTIEPHLLRAWTCWEKPPEESVENSPIISIEFDQEHNSFRSEREARALDWISLVSGRFFREHSVRFKREQRADQMLLMNLGAVREKLQSMKLADDIIHSLLARLIFVQFLRQRTDKSGVPALNKEILEKLHKEKILARPCEDLSSILEDKADTYHLFRWLNERFNGDLFPGKGATEEDRDREWRLEMDAVNVNHLKVLSDFVRGDFRLNDGQCCLWSLYSFDTIPLDFISSIYEEFVSKAKESLGAHYTPGHVVDFVLDKVLPWSGSEWDLRILDPSCGSGIFLVKCFQRLVYRWRLLNPGREVAASVLRGLLENNLFGIDINPHAIRVASFSLYLAMCDEIDPRRYWTECSFPRLRDKTLLAEDFFADSGSPRKWGNEPSLDLIVGNAPWGKGSLTSEAKRWAVENDWPAVNKQIGALFVPKAAMQVRIGGRISMLLPAGSMLFNRSPTAIRYRKKLFTTYAVEEVVDFSALRNSLFSKSAGPSCLITLWVQAPMLEPISYYHPTPTEPAESDYRLVLDTYGGHSISCQEAASDPWIWTVLAWGGRRDLALLKRLFSLGNTLKNLGERPGWYGREGFKRGDRKREKPHLADGSYRLVKADSIAPFVISGDEDFNFDPKFHSRDSSDDSVFKAPILLITKGWTVSAGFRAAIVHSNAIFPASSVYGLHFPEADKDLAEAACIVINSRFPGWFLSLTSGRAVSYRPEILAGDLLALPVGCPEAVKVKAEKDRIENLKDEEVDRIARNLLGFKDVEWTLVEDFTNIILREYRQPGKRVGKKSPTEKELVAYCEYFLGVLRSGFGEGKSCGATIFEEEGGQTIGFQLVAVHLEGLPTPGIKVVSAMPAEIMEILRQRDKKFREQARPESGGVFYQRVARVYDSFAVPDTEGGWISVPTIYLVKPNELRYWTRSIGLRDADSICAELMSLNIDFSGENTQGRESLA